MTLERKLLLIIFLILSAGMGLIQYGLYQRQHQLAEDDLLQRAEQIRNVLMATRRIYHHQFIDSGVELTAQTIGFLPAHAMNRISADFHNWDGSGLSFNNVSDDPRNPEQQADAIEARAIEYFRAHPEEERRFTAFRSQNGARYYHYAQPIWIEPYCLQCHGAQADAPEAIRSAYDTAYDFALGDLRGILSIKIPASKIEDRVQQAFIFQLGWGLTLLMILWASVAWIIRRFVTRPLGVLEQGMNQVGQGQLDHRIDRLHGEFRIIGETFNRMGAALSRNERQLQENEQKFQTMVDGTRDWEYWIRADGSFHYSSPSVEQLTGYSAAELAARPELIDEMVHPDDRYLWDRHLASHLHGADSQQEVRVEMRVVHRDGSTRWVEHSCRPIMDGEGYQGRRVSVRDIGARKQAEAEIQRLAYSDPLTGLANRRQALERLDQALLASDRSAQWGAVFLLDLDHFKKINDVLGHKQGDELLRKAAECLRSITRRSDTLARLGGDEFVLLAEDLASDQERAAQQAEIIAAKIRSALAPPCMLSPDAAPIEMTASIGVTLFLGEAADREALLRQADVAMYQAKNEGRNGFRFFDPEMQALLERRGALEQALRQALVRDEFELHFQPQVDRERRWVGVEALVRWRDPRQGLIPPMQFIPLAEETGLIVDIGQWVLDAACATLSAWSEHPQARNWQVAVNVSARQFHQPDFVQRVRSTIEHHGIKPRRLVLEVTEHVVLEDIDGVADRMHELSRLGVTFALDDFGTGYSSLNYLKHLPIAKIKIDQSFVRDITSDGDDAAIVCAVLAMGRALRIGTIAEGVETQAQHEFLLAQGCDEFQGYLFGRPMPAAELLDFLSE